MPEKPPFDPNRPYEVGTTDDKGKKPAFNPNKPFEAVGPSDADNNVGTLKKQQDDENALRSSITDASDAEKEYVIDMHRKGATPQEIEDAKLTIQGKHPLQEGGFKYYLEPTDKGYKKPVPINNDEKVPYGKEVNSIWGTQDEANDNESRLTDITKKVFNVLPKIGESVNDLTQAVYGTVTGEELPWYQNLKNASNYLQARTNSEYDKSILKGEKIHNFSDLVDLDNWEFNPSTIANTITNVGQSVVQFAATRGALGTAGKAASAEYELGNITKAVADKAIKAENLAKGFSAAYLNNIGEAMDAANNLGVTGRDAYLTAMAATVPIAAVDMMGGGDVEINKAFAAETGKNLVAHLVQGAIKDADGNISKEVLDNLFKTAYTAAETVAKKSPKTLLRTAGEEAGQEVGQNLIQKTSQVIHDNLVSDEQSRYGTELFSPESLADYLNDAFGGLIGGAQGHVLGKFLDRKEKNDEKSNTILAAINNGKTDELKTQLAAAKKSGDISEEDYNKGVFKIDSYQKYADATKDRNLDEESKRRIFDLTYHKANLNEGITQAEANNVDGINDGLIAEKKEKVKEFDQQINDIWKGAEEEQTKKAKPITKFDEKFKYVEPKDLIERKKFAFNEHLPAEEFNTLDSEDKFHYIYDKLSNKAENQGATAVKGILKIPKGASAQVDINGMKLDLASSDLRDQRYDNSILKQYEDKLITVKAINNNNFKALALYDENGKQITNGKEGRKRRDYFIRATPESLVSGSKYGADEMKVSPWKHGDVKTNGNFNTWDLGHLMTRENNAEQQGIIRGYIRNPDADISLGKTYNEFTHRIIGAYKKLLENANDKTVLVTHGHVMKVIDQWEKQGRPEDLSTLNKEEIIKQEEPRLKEYAGTKGKIFVARTAETALHKKFIKESHEPLSKEGEKNAELLGKELKELGAKDVISSSQKRANDTAIIIKKELGDSENKIDKPVKPIDKINNLAKNKENENSDNTKKPESGERISEQNKESRKKQKRQGLSKSKQKIVSPLYLKALQQEVFNPYDLALQYFINKGNVSSATIKDLYNNSRVELNARISYIKNGAPSAEQIAEKLVSDNESLKNTEDQYLEAVIDIIQSFTSRTQMAEDLVKRYQTPKFTEQETLVNEAISEAEQTSTEEEVSEAINAAEDLSEEEFEKLANDQEAFDKWFKNLPKDEDLDEGDGIYFQKPKEITDTPEFKKWFGDSKVVDKEGNPLIVYHGTNKEFGEFKSTKFKTAGYFTPNKELADRFSNLKTKYHGGKENTIGAYLSIKNPVDLSRINGYKNIAPDKFIDLLPFKSDEKFFADVKEKIKYQNPLFSYLANSFITDYIEEKGYDGIKFNEDDVESYIAFHANQIKSPENNNGEFNSNSNNIYKQKPQKESSEKADKEIIENVTDYLKKANPKLKIEFDEKLKDKDGNKLSGQVSVVGDVKINPFYAGKDTPIHEVAHILIDSIGGLENKVIAKAVEQLKPTKLWKETALRYPELSEEMLSKEVLAEAIGREGADIFETELAKSKFRQLLDFIYDKIKTVLGINKTLVKSLAKKVLRGGISGDKVKDANEQRIKEEAYKHFGEAKPMPKNYVAQKRHGINIKKLQAELEDAGPERKAEIKELLQGIDKEYEGYLHDIKNIKSILKENRNIDDIPEDRILDMYYSIMAYDDTANAPYFKDVMFRIAQALVNKQNKLLESKGVDTAQAKFRDLKQKDILMKSLSHIQEYFPEVQQLSKMWDDVYEEYVNEKNKLGKELAELGKKVVKEQQKGSDKFVDLISGDNSKYFKWMDYQGKLLSVTQAKEQSLSDTKIAYLEKYHEIKKTFKEQQDKTRNVYDDFALIKSKTNFTETYKKDGLIPALQTWLTDNTKTGSVVLKYDTGFKTLNEINEDLQAKVKNGSLTKAMAAIKSTYYALRAQKFYGKKINEDGSKLEDGSYSNYTLNQRGEISNQFGSEFKGNYTQDFHQSMLHYINDMSFSKHVSPILPYVYSIEYFNNNKFGDKEVKPNVSKFLEYWKAKHIFKENKVLFPEADLAMRFLRHWTSMIAMTFNARAGLWNAVVGKYNSWRELGAKASLIGEKRFFRKSKTGKWLVAKKARAVLEKYNVVASENIDDVNSHVGKALQKVSRIFSELGEYYVQGTQFLGQISKEDWASIDEEGNYTGENKTEFEKRIKKAKKRVSDIQGKYSEKDRRNFELWELGRFLGQFRTWLPDWFKERFGENYIDANGDTHQGSWRTITEKSFKDLAKAISTREFYHSEEPYFTNMRKNLRDLVTMGVLISMNVAGDDDKKRIKGDALSQATQNLLGVFDPSTLKYMIETPAAGLKPTKDFLNALEDAFTMQEYKSKNKYGNKGDLKATADIAKLLPYHNLVMNDYLFPNQ